MLVFQKGFDNIEDYQFFGLLRSLFINNRVAIAKEALKNA